MTSLPSQNVDYFNDRDTESKDDAHIMLSTLYPYKCDNMDIIQISKTKFLLRQSLPKYLGPYNYLPSA